MAAKGSMIVIGTGAVTNFVEVSTTVFDCGKARSVFEQLIIKPINSTNAMVNKFDFFIMISFKQN